MLNLSEQIKKKSVWIEADKLSFECRQEADKVIKLLKGYKILRMLIKPLNKTMVMPGTTPEQFDKIIEQELIDLVEKNKYTAIFLDACPESQLSSYYKIIQKYDLLSVVWFNNGSKLNIEKGA